MSDHTPGPWICGECKTVDDSIKIEKPSEDGVIAEVFPYFHKDREDESISNANLISAAPDLLEALELVVNYFAPHGTGKVFNLGYPTDYAREKLILAAIAKARGES